MAAENSARLSQLSECLPSLESKEGPHTVADIDGLALAAFLDAAGLKAGDLAGTTALHILRTAGELLSLMAGGLTELLHSRAQLKDTFRVSQTIIKGQQNNPMKFSASVEDALKFLLGSSNDSYLTPQEAVKATFEDIKNHEQAMAKAMMQALNDYLDRFDPDELRNQYDQGLKRSPLLAGTNKLKYWDLYAESYQILTYGEEGKLPEAFSQEFARAYEEEVEAQKLARPAATTQQ